MAPTLAVLGLLFSTTNWMTKKPKYPLFCVFRHRDTFFQENVDPMKLMFSQYLWKTPMVIFGNVNFFWTISI